MSAALILLGYAGVLTLAGPRLLAGAGWVARAPKLAVIAWQALTTAVVVSTVLAGFALLVPTVRVSAGLADLLRACIMTLREQYATPGGAAIAGLGATLALGTLARLAWCLTASLLTTVRQRGAHHDALTVIAIPSAYLGTVVVEHSDPAVYCLPGRHRRIVITTGALAVLDDAQLHAALAHERAHLDQRHHLVLAFSSGLATAFGRVALFTRAHDETTRLVELLADDVAARTTTRLTLAEALLNLTGAPSPQPALAAGGSTAAARVRRLLGPHRPLGRGRTAATATAVTLMVALPLLGLATPALATGHLRSCPPDTSAAAPANTGTAT